MGGLAPEPRLGLPRAPAARGRGLVFAETSGTGKLFRLTDEGRTAAEAGDVAPWETASESVDAGVWDLLGAMKQVGLARSQIARIATPEQVAAAQEILTGARKALYGILADDESGPSREA